MPPPVFTTKNVPSIDKYPLGEGKYPPVENHWFVVVTPETVTSIKGLRTRFFVVVHFAVIM